MGSEPLAVQPTRARRGFLVSLVFLLCPLGVLSAPTTALQEATAFKSMSLEELFDLEVTTGRRREPLREVASAAQVVTRRDIARSAVASLPEALRLAPNLHVAQVNSHDRAITARGFNGAPLSNNSLVSWPVDACS